jgi:hypothetical protein
MQAAIFSKQVTDIFSLLEVMVCDLWASGAAERKSGM